MTDRTQTARRPRGVPTSTTRHDLGVVFPVATRPVALAGRVVLGRAPGPGGLPVADATVSSRHCEVYPARGAGGAFVVSDLQSKNGSAVDGAPCDGPALLEDQAVLRVGDALLVYDRWRWPEPPPPAQAGRALARARAELQIDRLVARPHHVLIQGPTGAGKERLAQRLGHARGGPFEAVNCAVLSPELAAGALFGHTRGAFTGATTSQMGLFQRCDGGTLFLDEVAELDARAQAMLLRALEGEVRPLGARAALRVDVRVVAATHRPLAEAVADGAFRQDLYARLSTFVVQLPALAQRRADILPIFHELAAQHGPLGPLTVEGAERLLRAPWPHNVRGLQQVVHRLAVIAPQAPITAALLGAALFPEGAPEPVEVAPGDPDPALVEELLRRASGNVRVVADAVGLSRAALYRRLKRWGIDPESFRT